MGFNSGFTGLKSYKNSSQNIIFRTEIHNAV